jgi:hypothetical protein
LRWEVAIVKSSAKVRIMNGIEKVVLKISSIRMIHRKGYKKPS